MKKIKKIFTLSVTTLLMGGLVVCIPKNTKIVSAGVVHTKFTDEGAAATTRSISNRYSETFTLRTRHPKTGEKGKVTMLISRDRYGYLRMDIARLSPPGHVFDDDYAFAVISGKNNLPRVKWTTTFDKKPTIYEELISLTTEFNRVRVGHYDKIAAIGKNSLDSVLWDTQSGNALIRHGYNRWEKGFDSEWNKYSILFRITDNGLYEERNIWGHKDLFIYK